MDGRLTERGGLGPRFDATPPLGWLRAAAIRCATGGTLYLFTEPEGEGVFLLASPAKDDEHPSTGPGAVQMERNEFFALGLLLDRESPRASGAGASGIGKSGPPRATSPLPTRRAGGRPRMSPVRARRLLLDRVTRFRAGRDSTDPLTNVGLAKATRPKHDEGTIANWLTRAAWTLDELDIEWTHWRRKKPE